MGMDSTAVDKDMIDTSLNFQNIDQDNETNGLPPEDFTNVGHAIREPIKNINLAGLHHAHASVIISGNNEDIHGNKLLKLTHKSKNALTDIKNLNQLEKDLDALLDSDRGVEVPDHLKTRLEKFGLDRNAKLTKAKKETIKKDIVNQRDLLKLEYQTSEPEIRKILYHMEAVNKCAQEAIRMKREEDRKAAELPR
jgi:hypothetical protein